MEIEKTAVIIYLYHNLPIQIRIWMQKTETFKHSFAKFLRTLCERVPVLIFMTNFIPSTRLSSIESQHKKVVVVVVVVVFVIIIVGKKT